MAQTLDQLCLSDGILTLRQISLKQFVVSLNRLLDQLGPPLFSLVQHVGRDFSLNQLMIGVVLVSVRLHINQINDAVNCLLETDR